MAKPSLTVADSDKFRELLAESRRKHKWSLVETGVILGCTKRTVIRHLKDGCATRVRESYAVRLASFLGVEPPWDTQHKIGVGLRGILNAWRDAANVAQQRRVAWRLAIFMSETAVVDYRFSAEAKVIVGTAANPFSIEIVYKPQLSNESAKLIVHFEEANRSFLRLYAEMSNTKQKFNGILDKTTFIQILKKIRSWQKG